MIPLADFALIRRFAPPSPPGGRLLRQSLVVRDSADLSVRLRSRTEKIRTAGRSLPPGGEGGAPASDEGEIGEWNHFMQPSRRRGLSFQRGRLFSVVRGVLWFLLTMEIPPAGAPLGAGFDCAAMFGYRT